jgi:hypothetical protein
LEAVFSVECVLRLYSEDKPLSLEKSRVVSLQLAVGRQTRRRPSQTVALGGGVGRWRRPHFCKLLRSNAELVVRYTPVYNDVDPKSDERPLLEDVTQQGGEDA